MTDKEMIEMDYLSINREKWSNKVIEGNCWTTPVTSKDIDNARNGKWQIRLTPSKDIPRSWFPKNMTNLKILCLASGGGQQGPILAATGANITVVDFCEEQLKQDIMVAKRNNLHIKTLCRDMRDLSIFKDEEFDIIINPWSNCFIDDVKPVWKECYRILKYNGCLMAGFSNGFEYIFDLKEFNNNDLVIRHSLPYSDLNDLSKEEIKSLILDKGNSLCFGHTLTEQIQGQINAGFVISEFFEDISGTILDKYISGSINTKALKLSNIN